MLPTTHTLKKTLKKVYTKANSILYNMEKQLNNADKELKNTFLGYYYFSQIIETIDKNIINNECMYVRNQLFKTTQNINNWVVGLVLGSFSGSYLGLALINVVQLALCGIGGGIFGGILGTYIIA